MAQAANSTILIPDGTFDFVAGVDSSKVTTLQSELNPNGLRRNQLAWMNNASARGGSVRQRTGWQPLTKILDSGRWQGGYMYEPDGANPYLVCSISGHIYRVLLEDPYTVTDLSADFGLINPADAEMAWFVQGESYLVIQAGDFYTDPAKYPAGTLNDYGQTLLYNSSTLPLFWDGKTLRRSRGITSLTPGGANGINELPAATCMDYYGNRIWYAQARAYSAGDIVGGTAGTVGNHYRDSILNVTENPLALNGDGFSVPTSSGNIRALKHSANLNAALGEGQLFIFTRKTIYTIQVPTSRYDWINAGNDGTAATSTMPLQTVVQLVNGSVGDRCVVAVNGDLFYVSFDPAIRSLITAVRYFQQWGNTPISQNESRAIDGSDRALMRFSSGIEFDNRLLMLALPVVADDGVNVVHSAILPLDFDLVTSLDEKKPPSWEGAYDGLQFVQLFKGDFGGLPRAFSVAISDIDGSFMVWELTAASRTENGDNRVTWAIETPAYTWATAGLEYKLKNLKSGELWIDKISGTVEIDIYYRVDADPCWRRWLHTSVCAARNCAEQDPVKVCYPEEPACEGYRFTVVFPEPKFTCDVNGVRPTTIGYQFQCKVVLKGWARIRGLLLYAIPFNQPQFQGIACPTTSIPQGMAKLPNPFA